MELIDNLGLGNNRAPGFVTLIDYNAGRNRDAGLWIKGNGSNVRCINSRFSADDSTSADGVRVDSPNAAPVFCECDWHWVCRDGIRITDAFSVTVHGGDFYEIGQAGAGAATGRGIHCVSGNAKVRVLGGSRFESQLRTNTSRRIQNAVRLATNFSGAVEVRGASAVATVGNAWSNASAAGGTLSVEQHTTQNVTTG